MWLLYTKTKTIWDQLLHSIELNPTCECKNCSCAVIKKLLKSQQDMRLVEFLRRLYDGYEVVRGSILMVAPLPRISQAYKLLMQEERHKQLSNFFLRNYVICS